MTQPEGPGEERREFFRLDFRRPVKFREFQTKAAPSLRLGTAENISQSGILFKTRVVPPLSSVLWMDVDLRTLRICREIEKSALIQDRGILGRVVRVEEDPDEAHTYDVGVCFLRKSEKISV